MAEVTFRGARWKDAPLLAKVDEQCFAIPWSTAAFLGEFTEPEKAVYILAEVDGEPIGFAGLHIILDEGHITNVGVIPAYRGNKVGDALVELMIKEAEKRGVTMFTLEVRESNEVAQNLYRKYGFEEDGRRKGYYADNHEDAIIMWRR